MNCPLALTEPNCDDLCLSPCNGDPFAVNRREKPRKKRRGANIRGRYGMSPFTSHFKGVAEYRVPERTSADIPDRREVPLSRDEVMILDRLMARGETEEILARRLG